MNVDTLQFPRNVVLIHGLFLSWSSWENWTKRFTERGFNVLAPGWPGLDGSVEELRADPSPFTKLNIETVIGHYDRIIRELDSPPIIMGHSFGGLFAQVLAYRGLGVAAVGLDPGAPAGVLALPFSTLKAGAPVLGNPFNVGGATMLTPAQFHYAFTDTISPEESQGLYDRYAVPCANRVFFEGALENFAPPLAGEGRRKIGPAADSADRGWIRSSCNARLHEIQLSAHQRLARHHRLQGVCRTPAPHGCGRRVGSGGGFCPRLGAKSDRVHPRLILKSREQWFITVQRSA